MKTLVVVGGGITGLAAAFLAAKAGVAVTVLESSSTIGGLLGTFDVGGNRLERFYHHIFTHDVEIRWLLRELGIEDRLKFITGTMGVFRGGRSYSFNSPGDLLRFKPLVATDKLRFAVSSIYLGRLAKWQHYESVPALDWFRQHVGSRATQTLWEPLLRMKFGPYASQLPLSWIIGRLHQRMCSREAGREKLGYIQGSYQILIDAITMAFERLGVQVQTGVRVVAIKAHAGAITELQTTVGIVQADAYLFTIPTPHLAELLQPVNATYANELRQIEYFGAACTVLELKRSLSSVYWLNVADPGLPFGGVIEHTRLIPPSEYEGRHVVYLSRYFAMTDSLATQSTATVEQIMIKGLHAVFPHFSEADLLKVHLFSSRTAAVVCDLNFSRKVPACRTPIARLYLAAMPHVYPDERSCNNSVRIAAEACRVMGLESGKVPRCASLSGQINMR